MVSGRRWLEWHLEEFVRLQLGRIPEVTFSSIQVTWNLKLLLALKAVWERTKQEAQALGKPILLAGRDVWLLEVLARLDGIPTTYRSDISGEVGRAVPRIVTEDYTGHYLVDTGYSGSVPKGLGVVSYRLIALSPSQMPTPDIMATRSSHQVFPKAILTRTSQIPYSVKNGTLYTLANRLEASSKYWTHASVVTKLNGTKSISQIFSGEKEFDAAAQITQHVATFYLPYLKNYPISHRGRWRLSD